MAGLTNHHARIKRCLQIQKKNWCIMYSAERKEDRKTVREREREKEKRNNFSMGPPFHRFGSVGTAFRSWFDLIDLAAFLQRDEADLFMDVGLALVEEGRVESQRSHSQEEFVDVETGFGRNGPIFCLQRPGHSRCLIFNIRVRRFGLHHPIILISIISPCQFQCNYHYLCFLIRLLLAMFRIS